MKALYTISAALLIAVTLGGLGIQLDGPEAPPEVRKQARFEKSAAEICGINASFNDLGDGVIQCVTKQGRKAQKVAIK